MKDIDYYLNADRQEVYDRIEEEILDHFDFNKVHKVMEHLNWTWFEIGDEVPSVSDIRKKARALLRECADKLLDNPDDNFPDYAVGTGGLYAKAYRGIDSIDYFRLYFAVESWDNFD